MASATHPLRAAANDLRARFGAKGGGSDRMIQGSVMADRDALTAWAQEYFSKEEA